MAAAVLLGVGALAALLLTRDNGDGDDLATVNSGETEESTTTTTTTDPPDDSGGEDLLEGLEGLEGLEDIVGDGGLTGDGSGSGSSATLEPLPGSDWNDDARAQFVTDCAAGTIGSVAPSAGQTPDEFCGCLYDDISTSGTDFGDFNDSWTAEDSEDFTVAGSIFTDASFACIG